MFFFGDNMKLQALLEASQPKPGTWIRIKKAHINDFVDYFDDGDEDGYWGKEIKKDNEFVVMNEPADKGKVFIDKDGDEMEVPLKWVTPAKSPANTMSGHGRMGSSPIREGVNKKTSIKALKAAKEKLLDDYHAANSKLDRAIEAIRAKRGQKLKEPDWSGYHEQGRDADRKPRGEMG